MTLGSFSSKTGYREKQATSATDIAHKHNTPRRGMSLARYYSIEPEVAGGWGSNAEVVRTPGQPVVVHRLHYQFDGWLGDALLETTPCYIVATQLAEDIKRSGLTGASFAEVEISRSEQFEQFYPDRPLPDFVWLKPLGKAETDDFGVSLDLRLIVSEKALSVLRSHGITHAQISEVL